MGGNTSLNKSEVKIQSKIRERFFQGRRELMTESRESCPCLFFDVESWGIHAVSLSISAFLQSNSLYFVFPWRVPCWIDRSVMMEVLCTVGLLSFSTPSLGMSHSIAG